MDEMENMETTDETNTGNEENPSRDDAPVNTSVEAEDETPIEPPGPTPEEEEEWERERLARWEAKLKPFRDMAEAVKEHDDLMAEVLYEVTLIEIGGDE